MATKITHLCILYLNLILMKPSFIYLYFCEKSQAVTECIFNFSKVQIENISRFVIKYDITFKNLFFQFTFALYIYLSALMIYSSQFYLYSFYFYPFLFLPLNIYIGTFFLMLFNIILQFPIKSEDLWINPKISNMSLIFFIVTFYFVIISTCNFFKFLSNRAISGETFASFSSLSGNVLDHIDILLFFGIIILTFILLYEYFLLPYGIFWKTGFRCLISFFVAMIFSKIVILFSGTNSKILTPIITKIVEIEVTVGILVISLSIVIIQQIASSYLPAIGKLFTNCRTNPIFLITSFLYLASIFSGIWLLIQPDIPIKLLYMFFFLSISAFVSTIISFIPNVFNFLLPKNVIKLLHENRKITFSIKDENCMHILGILLNSLEKYDYDAAKECFNCVEGYRSELISSYKNNIVPRELDSYFALEKSLISVASYFITIGELSLKVGYNDCTIKVIENLYYVREVADEHKMESVISVTTKSIREFSKEVVYPLITELNDKNPDIHKYAVFALGEVGDERALSPIMKLLKNEDYTFISALMCTFISAIMKINPEYIIMFLLEVVENRNFNKNELITKVFFAYRKKEMFSQKLLIRLLKYNEPYIKGFAALGLGEVGDENDIRTLLCLLLDTEQPSYVRGKAASAIGTINNRYLLNKSTIYKLFERMSDLDPYVRYNAVYSLSKIKIEDSRIISKIEDLLLSDPDPYVRDSAVFALKEGNYSCSIESLNNALKKEKEENIRFNIILALGFIRGFNKIGPLLKYYFPQMSLPLYNLVCNYHFLDDERSSILPLYAAAFCTKSKYYGPNSRSKTFHDL